MSDCDVSAIWGSRKRERQDTRAAIAADILAGSGPEIVARHLAEASARNAMNLRKHALANEGVIRLDGLGWAGSYWEDAIDYLQFAGVLTEAQATLAHRLSWGDDACWAGTLEDLVTTVRTVTEGV